MRLRQRLRIDLTDKDYRHAYADEHLNLSIGTQIKVIREQQGMTQADLADRIGTKQAGVSRLESANYASWSIAALRRLAEAFDLRLRVSFEEFGTLWEEVHYFSRKSLERRRFDDDPEFKQGRPVGKPTSESTAVGILTPLGKQISGELNLLSHLITKSLAQFSVQIAESVDRQTHQMQTLREALKGFDNRSSANPVPTFLALELSSVSAPSSIHEQIQFAHLKAMNASVRGEVPPGSSGMPPDPYRGLRLVEQPEKQPPAAARTQAYNPEVTAAQLGVPKRVIA